VNYGTCNCKVCLTIFDIWRKQSNPKSLLHKLTTQSEFQIFKVSKVNVPIRCHTLFFEIFRRFFYLTQFFNLVSKNFEISHIQHQNENPIHNCLKSMHFLHIVRYSRQALAWSSFCRLKKKTHLLSQRSNEFPSSIKLWPSISEPFPPSIFFSLLIYRFLLSGDLRNILLQVCISPSLLREMKVRRKNP